MKKYYKWHSDLLKEGGMFSLDFSNEYYSFEYVHMTGNAPLSKLVLYLILTEPSCEQIAREYKRFDPWKVVKCEGMSGATNWYFQTLNSSGGFYSPKIWHTSMYDKANESIKAFVCDIFDCFCTPETVEELNSAMHEFADAEQSVSLEDFDDPQDYFWCLRQQAIEKILGVEIYDETSAYNAKVEAFKKDCYNPSEGYGKNGTITIFAGIGKESPAEEIQDYSIYSPVDEKHLE